MKIIQTECKFKIEDSIFHIRGKYGMIDRDLAILYGIETKALNQQVKRNQERFPENFMFRLDSDEFHRLVTFCDRFRIMKHSSSSPYAFTEQGVAMLSALLKSKTAVTVSIRIMESFVRMRRFVIVRQQQNENHIEKFLDLIEERKGLHPKQGIFFEGQIYDAYSFATGLIKKANERIILIDNYIDETVLTMMDKRKNNIKAVIYTSCMTRQIMLDIAKHDTQYASIDIKTFDKAHDRFLIIDEEVYLIGASIKDLGKKWFGFTLMENTIAEDIIQRLENK